MKTGLRLVVLLLLFANLAGAEAAVALLNPGFEQGLEGWDFRPGSESQVTVVDEGGTRGKVLALHPEGKLLGLDSKPLAIGPAIQADEAYQVEAQLKNEGLQKGVFAFSMYCYDAQGKLLQQIVFQGLNPKTAAYDWRTVRGVFGPGTANPLPEGTANVRLRFSFYEATGDCQGKVLVDAVRLEPFVPPAHGDWPKEIVATVGDLGVRFESRSFWTLYRIDYRGTRLCLDRFGSHYGSVVHFPGVGFIGSGHTENEDEQILDLKLFVDGQPVERPAVTVECKDLRLTKRSRIRALVLDSDLQVGDNRIIEDVRLRADEATPVSLIYHFMHPWTNTATEYCAELLDGSRVEGLFDGDQKQKINQATRWSAIYDGPSGKGAVTYVLLVPEDGAWRTRYWDISDRYRKHYFATFLGQTVPAGKEFHYRVVTVPFEAPADRWKAEAARMAEACKALETNAR